MVRVRFAPSPTGFLHLGGARTALFNWLYARHSRGVFVLRVEDTDKIRSKEVYLKQILEDLKWLGLTWDEGPYFQSKRDALYQSSAQDLLNKKLAYSEGRAIILRVPDKSFEFVDLIRGPITFAPGSFKDQVLIKSDGSPTYNFACCVDDHHMNITHIIRGEDHISNTPKQMAIYEALKFKLPEFAHIPLIVSADRSRLSKRKGAQPISYYRERGYLPQALFNFLSLLSWSLGASRELATQEEIIQEFTLERVLKTAAFFNPEKLEWMNGQYIQNLELKELTELVAPFLLKKRLIQQSYDGAWLAKVVELFRSRIKLLSEVAGQADFFFVERIEFSQEAEAFLRKQEKAEDIFRKLIEALKKIESFDLHPVEHTCRQLIAEEGIRAGGLIHPVRVALTGKKAGPGLFELMSVLGKEKVLARLSQALHSVV